MKKLQLAMNAGARAIENNKRLDGSTYIYDVFSDDKQEISYREASILLREQSESSGWISVDNRLPDGKGWYLVCSEGQRPYVAFFKGKTFPLNNHYHKIIAWQPLPSQYEV